MNILNMTFILQLVNTALLVGIPILVILFALRYSAKASKQKKAQVQSMIEDEGVKPNHKSVSVWLLSIFVIGLSIGLLLSTSKGMVIYKVPVHSNDITLEEVELISSGSDLYFSPHLMAVNTFNNPDIKEATISVEIDQLHIYDAAFNFSDRKRVDLSYDRLLKNCRIKKGSILSIKIEYWRKGEWVSFEQALKLDVFKKHF